MRSGRYILLASVCWLVGCDSGGSPVSPRPPATREACFDRAEFDPPSQSPYCLPYAEGEAFHVSQSYCSEAGWSHHTRFAYDFDLPLGTEVLNARAGRVVELREQFSDGNAIGGNENVVILRHSDDTLGVYIHMMQDGVLVEMGDWVPQGGLLGWSGSSGTSLEHLHFQICLKSGMCSTGTSEVTLPVSFRNAGGSLDFRGGLATGQTYTALPCS
jgi:murein DD-endopeptidase MepM/ murein hydrolase activator NlpD